MKDLIKNKFTCIPQVHGHSAINELPTVTSKQIEMCITNVIQNFEYAFIVAFIDLTI